MDSAVESAVETSVESVVESVVECAGEGVMKIWGRFSSLPGIVFQRSI